MRKLLFVVQFIVFMIYLSCDPTHPVSIKNNKSSVIVVDAKITPSFNPGITTTFIKDENERLQFKIEPYNFVECGFTIGGLKDDLPFTDVIIYSENDTIVAKNETEILELFDKNWLGRLKTPYTLTVE